MSHLPNTTLEAAEVYLEGESYTLFLYFMRKMLQWVPDERLSARELLMDPWLNAS